MATGASPRGCRRWPGRKTDTLDLSPNDSSFPPHVGHRGRLGVRLDAAPDWEETAGILDDAYRLVAPKTLVKKLDE